MEYKLILAPGVDKQTVEKVAKDWVRKHPGGITPALMNPPKPPVYGPPAPTRAKYGPPAPARPVYGPPAPKAKELALSPKIKLRQLSQMGQQQVHTFVYNEREVLIVKQGSLHHQWVRLGYEWESTKHGLQAIQAVKTPAQMSDWDRLNAAMASGIRQLKGQAMEAIQNFISSLLTWQGILLLIAVAAIFTLGGQVALLLLGAAAVVDLLLVVLPMFVDFYHKAVAARTQAQIDAAGTIFAQALLRGGLDVLDVLFGAAAYRRLMVIGGGRVTARAVWVYLSERVPMLMARLQKGAGKLVQLANEAKARAQQLTTRPRSTTRPLSGLKTPQGLTNAQFEAASQKVRARAAELGYGDDIVVQGSRAKGTARPDSDIDIGIRVSEEQFKQILNERFGRPNPGSAKERTLNQAIQTGKIQRGEAGMRNVGRQLESDLGMDVDISVIRVGGPFDTPPFVPLK